MGATLSKLWGAFRTAWAGGGSAGRTDYTPYHSNGAPRDVEEGLPTTNTPAKPPTPLPDMGGIQKWVIEEVSAVDFDV
jgi:hypothetical protein